MEYSFLSNLSPSADFLAYKILSSPKTLKLYFNAADVWIINEAVQIKRCFLVGTQDGDELID